MNTRNYENIDFTGFKHGRLTVIKKADYGKTQWVCKCDCGNEKTMTPYYFQKDFSCGCLEKENKLNLGEHNKTHGMTNSVLYSKYCHMKERCFNPRYYNYHNYGGRGITICDEWIGKEGFNNFLKWAYENGFDDSKKGYEQTLDRIDVDGNYEPLNCRWTDQKTQSRNRQNTLYISVNGNKVSCAEFCEVNKIDSCWARRRLHKGQSAEQILLDWSKKKKRHERIH